MISLLDKAAAMSVEDYNPTYVIETVNALHPLGKDEALDKIIQYLQNRGEENDVVGLFWVLRVLFDVPEDGSFPPVRIGQPNIPHPDVPQKMPRFPIVIIRDIPFLIVNGYTLSGLPEPVESHVAKYRDYGTLRGKPLVPADSKEGLEEEFLRLFTLRVTEK